MLALVVAVIAPHGSHETPVADRASATATAGEAKVSFAPRLESESSSDGGLVSDGACRVEGLVVDASRLAVAGATVMVGDLLTTSADDGWFEIDHVPCARDVGLGHGSMRATAELDDMFGEGQADFVTNVSDVVEIVMTSGPTLVLHVHDAHGHPVADARIAGTEAGCSDVDGIAILRGLDPDHVRLVVDATGFAQATLEIETTGLVELDRDVVLVRGSTIAGSVVTADGAPVLDAYVMLDRHPARVDSEGHWSFESIEAGEHTLVAMSLKHAHSDSMVVTADGNTDLANLRLEIPRGGTIIGIVVDEHGAPAARVQVTCTSSEVTDEHGQFTVTGVPEGQHHCVASTQTSVARAAIVTVSTTTPASVRLELVSSSIAGTVRDRRGAPIADARVAISGDGDMTTAMVRSDANGHFDFEGVQPGTYDVTARRSGTSEYASFGTVMSPKRDLAITLAESVTLTGRILVDGHPSRDAAVDISAASTTAPDR